MEDKTPSEQIYDIISMHGGWKGDILSEIRAAIKKSDPDIIEEIKWRMATRPEGLPVWSHSGIVCFAETWKDNIKLLFPKGAKLEDPDELFNARLQSKDIRAVELKEGETVNKALLGEMVSRAAKLNLGD